ncbi:hypothetical protein L7F22_039949 [Adiantum nelumboides]|nr:hypothetical protein [Adiantum nelumboides]
MGEPCEHKRQRQHTTCIVCTFLLVGLLLLLLILYFALFKPKDPRVQVPSMQLLSYSIVNGGAGSSLSLNLQVSLYNPNRGEFVVQEGSSACLYYEKEQVGFSPIPEAIIPALSFSTTSVRLSSSSPIPDAAVDDNYGDTLPTANVLPIATSVAIVGHATTVNLFSHHSNVVAKCKIGISLASSGSASVQSYSCQSSYSLDD